MSYILEALQEAQKHRDDASVPDLKTVHVASDSAGIGGASRWTYLVGTLILLGGGLLTWWMTGVEPPLVTEKTVTEKPAIEQTVNQQDRRKALLSENTLPESSLPESTLTVEEKVEVAVVLPDTGLPEPMTKAAELERASTAPVSPAPNNLGQARFEEVLDDAQALEPVTRTPGKQPPASLRETTGRRPVLASKPVQQTKDPAAGLAGSTIEPQPENIGSEPVALVESGLGRSPQEEQQQMPEPTHRSVPHFRELAFDIQKSLPPITYSVHLYAAEPKHRMVKIDGRVRREGDTVKPGLVLEEIIPTGAVFSFKDNIFRVPVGG